MKDPEGRRFYGSVTVSERGQIVIPAEARRDFDINTGDKLLVFGDLSQGLAMAKAELLLDSIEGLQSILQSQDKKGKEEGGGK
jgi:AbrB family looped-hinge helix DNA binding protein